MSLGDAVQAALLTISVLGLAYLALGAFFVTRMARRPSTAGATAPSVTLLKPLHGAEPGLAENLASFCTQDYGGPLQVVLGVQNGDDTALPAARALARAFPDLEIEIVVDPTPHGANRKVANLINMEREIRNEVVVLSDSDMRVPPDYLARVVGALARPGVGAVTCLYHGRAAGNVWSRLAALGIDSHFLPSVAVGTGLGLANPCFGSTIALRRETLAATGGFRAIRDDLADDYMLGAAVRRLGLDVAIPAFTVGHTFAERSLRAVIAQELRWARTVRQIDPAGHAGSLLAHPFPFALAAFLMGPDLLGLACAAAAIALRIGICLAVERGFGVEVHPYRFVPARDLLSFGIFVASFFGRNVSWRGHRYNVATSGALIADKVPGPR